MFLEKLVEQHRVHRVVAHCVDFALRIPHYEIWINSSDVLRDQTKLRRAGVVALLAKCHWLQRQDRFVHRFDFLLKLGRRTSRAELAGGVDYDRKSVAVLRLIPESVADKAGVAHIRAWDADSNCVVGCRDVEAGLRPAVKPNAILPKPVMMFASAPLPTAVLPSPLVLFCSRRGSDGRVVAAFGVLKTARYEASLRLCCPWASRASALMPIAVLSANSIAEKRSISDSSVGTEPSVLKTMRTLHRL